MEILPRFSDARLDTAKSLQGLQNRSESEKIWINRNATPFWPDIFKSKYGYDVTWSQATNTDDGLMDVLNQYAGVFDGYILYDESGNEVSRFVALSLAGILDAVVIDDSVEASFISNVGKPKLADVRTRDAAWLWANYGTQFSKTGMGLPNTPARTMSADYAIMQRWAFIPSTESQTTCENFLGSLDANATVTGWIPDYLLPDAAEDQMVTYFSNFDVKLLPGVNTLHNFSAIAEISNYSSGSKAPITFSQDMDKPGYVFDPSKHYVALYCNSGGNLNYLHYRYLTDTGSSFDCDNFMNVPHSVPLTLSMSPMATKISAAALREIYDRKSPQDSFATPYSGYAYIHPSLYNSLTAFASGTHTDMERADQTCLASHETGDIIDQNWVDNVGAILLDSDQVSGILCQRGPYGKVYEGPNKKPVITRRRLMEISDSAANMTEIINAVNGLQPDPDSQGGYTVIQVNLEKTNIQDCQELYESVDSQIKFVTLEELFYHIRHQVFGVEQQKFAELSVEPAEDTYCKEETPTATYGDAEELRVRAPNALDKEIISYLKFDVNIEDDRAIDGCWLWLKSADSMDDASVYLVQDNGWDEDTLNWDNRPAIGAELTKINNVNSETWYAFNVSSRVTSNGTYSFAIQTSDDNISLDWYSSATTTSPYLMITTNSAPVPQNVTASAGDQQVTLTWGSLPGVMEYVVKRKQGWDGSFTVIAESVTGMTYTDTGLTNGEGYYYTVSSIYENGPNPHLESMPSAQVGASPADDVFDSVLADLTTGGANALSTVVTFDNLDGTVTATSSATGDPAIDPDKNGVTYGATGVLKLNVEAFDDSGSPFVPDTWSGGAQSAGCKIQTFLSGGWGVMTDAKVNGNLQLAESLRITVDTSSLNLQTGQKVMLRGIAFSVNGDVWIRNTSVAVGVSGAGVQLADDVTEYVAADVELRDGDQLALMRGSLDTFIAGIEFDIVYTDPVKVWMQSYGVYGDSDTDRSGDVDGDNLIALYEYGVNGDPTDPSNKGVVPEITGLINDGGNNYLEYVYVRRYNPPEIVSVHPETTTDLLSGVWTNAHYNVISTTPLDHEFEVVTNRVDTVDPTRLIRLRVDGP